MTSTIRIGAHVRSVMDADGAVLLDLKHGRYFSLNETAVSVWRLLETGATLPTIEAELGRGYGGPESVGRDITAFVDMLRRAELVYASE